MRTRVTMLAAVLAASAAPAAAETYPVYKPLANNPHDDHAACHGKYWKWYSHCQKIRDDEAAQYKADASSGSQSPLFDEYGYRFDGRRDGYGGAPSGTTSESTFSGYAALARHKPLWGFYAPGTSAHPTYEENGSTINSCQEYGYKRYYQINRHLDAIGRLTAARRYSSAVNIILDGSPAVADAKPIAPATGYYFVDYEGQAVTQFTPHFNNNYLVQKLTPPDNRNPFWQIPTNLIKSLPSTNADWEDDIDWALAVSNSKSSPSNARTWDYAKQMRSDAAITSLSAAERDEIAARILRMRRALFRAAKQFEKCANDRFFKLTTKAVSPEHLTFEEYVARVEPGAGYTDPIEWYELGLQGQLLDDAAQSSTLSKVLDASATSQDIYYQYSRTQTGKTLRSLASVDRYALEDAVANTTTSYKSDPLAGCNAGYAEVAALLVEEYRRGGAGCMATNTKKCEFSPVLFARDVQDQLALRIPDIDLAKEQCLTYLGAFFDSPWYGVPEDKRTNLAKFEEYFETQKAELDEVVRDTPRRSELPDSIGDRRGGGSQWGDPARFGAGYAYEAEWGANVTSTTSTGKPCRLGGQVKSSLSAYIIAFGVRRDLIAAGLKARTAQPGATESAPDFDASVNVLGIDVYRVEDASLPQSFWHSGTDTHEVPVVRSTVLLGAIPVAIDAGVDFDYGYRLAANFEQTDCNESTPPKLRLSGVVSPHAGADAYVSAYLDLYAVSAGVKGELTLVDVHLPFDASIAVQPHSSNDDSFAVHAKSSLQLDLVELSGSIAFVAKVIGIKVWEKVLFQWGGIRQTISLWAHDLEFELSGFQLL